ncbi:MAG TPA: hypothetical protein VNU46_05725 [Gemmatimonadaceae bacterium]|jgi:hypothetical protein|nr:hypothetical protein [Gemmatimonadaceae bacterium]
MSLSLVDLPPPVRSALDALLVSPDPKRDPLLAPERETLCQYVGTLGSDQSRFAFLVAVVEEAARVVKASSETILNVVMLCAEHFFPITP